MLECPNCSQLEEDGTPICSSCGSSLSSTPKPNLNTPPATKSERGKKDIDLGALTEMMGDIEKGRRVDIMFVLDCTGSMGGEIEAIKNSIVNFVNSIEKAKVRARVGLVEFRDRTVNQEHILHRFNGEVFTNQPEIFRNIASCLKAEGGRDKFTRDDERESSLDAIMLALKQPFQEKNRCVVLITDAPPHIPDRETKSIDEVIAAIKSVGLTQFYAVTRPSEPWANVYLRLTQEVGSGMVFDLGKGDDFSKRSDNFEKVLMSLGKTISAGTH